MWRGVSLRKLALLILGPFLVATLATMLSSWMWVQATAWGYKPKTQMLLGCLGSAAYAFSAYLAGRWVKPSRASAMMLGAILATTVCGLAALWVNTFTFFLVAAPLLGFCMGQYYVPFQINMSHVKPFHTLAWTVAFYNISWGIGEALGPATGAWLREYSTESIAGLALALAMAHTALILLAWKVPQPVATAHPVTPFTSRPAQRQLAWLSFFTAAILARGLYVTLWPGLAFQSGWSDPKIIAAGYVALLLPVTLAAPFWALLRNRMNRPWLMLGSMLLAAVGFGALGFCRTWQEALVCLACVGMAESCTVFHAVYYANADPQRPTRSVGITEMVAGVGFLMGPLLLGLIAWDDATSPRVYLCGAGLMGIVVLVGARWDWRIPPE